MRKPRTDHTPKEKLTKKFDLSERMRNLRTRYATVVVRSGKVLKRYKLLNLNVDLFKHILRNPQTIPLQPFEPLVDDLMGQKLSMHQ